MKKRILIVEDEVAIAMDLEMNLEILGYDVCGHAVSFQEAIELYTETQPDLVLMDINLHGDKSGIDVSLWIKERANTPIIFLTAFNDDSTFKNAVESEPYGYIVKPFTSEELRNHIAIALKKSENILSPIEYLKEIFDDYKSEVVALTALNEPKYANKIYLQKYSLSEFDWEAIASNETNDASSLNIETYSLNFPSLKKLIMFGKANDSEWGNTKGNKFLFIKDKRMYSRVLFTEILWLEALDNYTTIYTTTGKHTVLGYLSEFENKLDSNFVRVHRSYIVSLDKIKKIEDLHVVFDEKKVPISRARKEELLNRLRT
ncbi:MAG: response regulator [Bacteroidia bacterium]|nr:response regulator [Bacteroidia bacterium]NNJ55725.1 response regulator [Bacteroidia bacterium]